jgi:hypothetical protein
VVGAGEVTPPAPEEVRGKERDEVAVRIPGVVGPPVGHRLECRPEYPGDDGKGRRPGHGLQGPPAGQRGRPRDAVQSRDISGAYARRGRHRAGTLTAGNNLVIASASDHAAGGVPHRRGSSFDAPRGEKFQNVKAMPARELQERWPNTPGDSRSLVIAPGPGTVGDDPGRMLIEILLSNAGSASFNSPTMASLGSRVRSIGPSTSPGDPSNPRPLEPASKPNHRRFLVECKGVRIRTRSGRSRTPTVPGGVPQLAGVPLPGLPVPVCLVGDDHRCPHLLPPGGLGVRIPTRPVRVAARWLPWATPDPPASPAVPVTPPAEPAAAPVGPAVSTARVTGAADSGLVFPAGSVAVAVTACVPSASGVVGVRDQAPIVASAVVIAQTRSICGLPDGVYC